MIESGALLAVYSQFLEKEDGVSKIHLLHIFDEFGAVDKSLLETTYFQLFSQKVSPNKMMFGPFNDMDDFNKFIYALLQKGDYKKSIVLSVNDVNTALDGTDTCQIFKNKTFENANITVNDDKKEKSGFFNRFFKD